MSPEARKVAKILEKKYQVCRQIFLLLKFQLETVKSMLCTVANENCFTLETRREALALIFENGYITGQLNQAKPKRNQTFDQQILLVRTIRTQVRDWVKKSEELLSFAQQV